MGYITFANEGENAGWFLIRDAAHFESLYPLSKPGQYSPQPWSDPDKYPCLAKQLAVIDNPNGSDHAMLAYIYDFVEFDEWPFEF